MGSLLYIVPRTSTDRGSGMATSSIRKVIRLVPAASRAPSRAAAALSLVLHAALIACAFQGGGHGARAWLPLPPAPRPTPANTLRFVMLPPAAHEPETPGLAAGTVGRAGPVRRPIRYVAPASLEGPARPFFAAPRISPAELMEAIVGDREAALAPYLEVSTSAELRGRPGDACPELRRPRGESDARDTLAVAVTFVVDAAGIIDQSTMKVVQAPGMPALRTGFVPHIYTVSATARTDRSLPRAAGAYGPIVADDVVRHVARLRFHPGSRNGQPAQSMVLISCQVS